MSTLTAVIILGALLTIVIVLGVIVLRQRDTLSRERESHAGEVAPRLAGRIMVKNGMTAENQPRVGRGTLSAHRQTSGGIRLYSRLGGRQDSYDLAALNATSELGTMGRSSCVPFPK